MAKSKHRKLKKKRKGRAQSPPLKPYTPIKQRLFLTQNPFRDVPNEVALDHFRKMGQEAKRRWAEQYPKLSECFIKYDAPYLLSFCVLYFLSEPAGVDKEATGEKLEFPHHFLELLQAFALMQPRSGSVQPLAERISDFKAFMREIGDLMLQRDYDVPEGITDEEFAKRRILADLRAQTTVLRNPAYLDQLLSGAKKLFSKVTPIFDTCYDIEPDRLIVTLEKICQHIEDRLNEHISKLRDVLKPSSYEDVYRTYVQAFPEVKSNTAGALKMFEIAGRNLERLKYMLVAHSDLNLYKVFTFTLDEIEDLYDGQSKRLALKRIFDQWAYAFGDLSDHNIDHFVLDNPILQKPLVKLSDTEYFWPTAGILGHLVHGVMEGLVRGTTSANFDKYLRAKAKFLEDEVANIFKNYFPSAEVFQSNKWQRPEDGKVYENDLLIVVDSFAFIVECKSGLVDPPARRGAERRLIATLQDLAVAPSIQAHRFIQHLSDNPGMHQFSNNRGEFNSIDLSAVQHFVPLVVVFEDLGNVSANLKEAVRSGLVKVSHDSLAPVISLTDLETIFELLGNEVERTHYLIRRSHIEKNMNYLGDEMDLLAFYIDTGFNLGDEDFNQSVSFMLALKSKEIDPYFVGKTHGVVVPKPQLKLTPWWRAIIELVLVRKPQRWLEIGYILLNVPWEDQVKFEKELKKLVNNTCSGKMELQHNWSVLITPPKERAYFIAAFPYIVVDRKERKNLLGHILQEGITSHNVLGGICIGTSIVDPKFPYNILAYMPGQLLGQVHTVGFETENS